jgi:hypothetical protein
MDPSLEKQFWMVGVQVRLKTLLGEEVEGEIFSFDSTSNCVVLRILC